MGLESFSLKDRHIVVVGASSGLGAETARQCASAGATVSICARREDKLKEVLASLEGSRPHRHAVLDASRSEEIEPCIADLAKANGPIDGLVYSAGMAGTFPLMAITQEKIDTLFHLNVMGAILSTKSAVKRMPKRGGSIVWISSTAARRTRGGLTIYAGTKAAMEGSAAGLVYELSRKKIRVNTVAPGAVVTEMWGSPDPVVQEQYQKIFDLYPLGTGVPSDVAYGCVYLLSDASRWVSGTVLTMDGGLCAVG